MSSIVDLWKKNKEYFSDKVIQQVISFTGKGKLIDDSATSKEVREFLGLVSTKQLCKYANECLEESFTNSGLILQDIINEMGGRLGFEITNGLYRGKPDKVGYDGIWSAKNGHKIIVEVKTTDAYRINLDTIAVYREKLIEEKLFTKNASSILIVVGRKDTGDLEAQIRGSRHAWDIRLISTESLINLLNVKEKLNDTKTVQQINEVLRPFEYTRIDKLIDLIFSTSTDIELNKEDFQSGVEESAPDIQKEKKAIPVSFHSDCIEIISQYLSLKFINQTKSALSTKDKKVGLICAISREHYQGQTPKYWFAFHPHQKEFLKDYDRAFIAYACGKATDIFLFPYDVFEKFIPHMWTTEKDLKKYWHVVIIKKDNKYLLQQPKNKSNKFIDISSYKLAR